MEQSHYPSNVITTSTSYPPSVTTSQSLPPSSLPQQLPPLHGNAAMQSAYGSYPHTPRTPGTPNTPASTGTMGSYPPPPSAGPGRGSYQMMPNNPYQQPHQSYATSSAMHPQTSTALSHPQPIAPAPPPSTRGPPILRPMPTGGVMPQPGMSSPYSQSPLMPQPPMHPDGDQPTHVVGSQGRRGILPSAPGRPAAPAAGSPTTKSQVPQKDADGKFPCPHCTKTYLHAKHLKRHLLRHTGDRPYMCVLCRDTFSRSDILKRHFQKCSIRRGNPTGASHLSHPGAHVKKNSTGQKQGEGELNQMNGMGNMPADSMTHHSFGIIPQPGGMSSDQNQLSRSSSINRLEDVNDRDRASGPGPVMAAPARGGNFDPAYNGNVQGNMNANINPQLANYNMNANQNGLGMFGGQNSNQQSNLDWSSVFQQAGAQDTYVHTFPPNNGQTQIAIKQEPSADAAPTDGLPGGNHNRPNDPNDLTDLTNRSLFFFNWGPSHTQDPYQQLSNQIINFLNPDYAADPHASNVNLYFSAENIKDFLDKYTHFHVHFSFLHIPTFRILDAYTGLLAAMCCIGACYSARVSAGNVRDMMDFVMGTLDRDSGMLGSLSSGAQLDAKYETGSFASSTHDVEELQAIMLMHTLFVWNGTPSQRAKARQIPALVAMLARKAGLLTVSKDSSLYSPLHQPGLLPQNFDVSAFDWASWVEQEKRNRIMFTIFAGDAALGLYFNSPSLFSAFEIHLPMPSDDAAWDAQDPTECAQALGLYGIRAARERNPYGTLRAKQPEMHLALRALLHTSYQIQTGTTNLFGKFILIHALLALIRKAHTEGNAAMTHGSTTPLAQNDWIVSGQDLVAASVTANSSGHATPVDGAPSPQTLKALVTALDKFKRNWDSDMANQFPPSSTSPRRHGFSRDGVHYYWLANYLLKNTRPADLAMAPDQRFTQVIHLLKSVKSWVMSDGASRGEELGSIGEIDEDYGTLDLTLNMVDLFKPLPRIVETPGITSVKTEIGTDGMM